MQSNKAREAVGQAENRRAGGEVGKGLHQPAHQFHQFEATAQCRNRGRKPGKGIAAKIGHQPDPRQDACALRVEKRAHAALRQIGFQGETIELSNRGGAGFAAWLGWLEREVAAQRERAARGETARPSVQPEGASAHAAHQRPPRRPYRERHQPHRRQHDGRLHGAPQRRVEAEVIATYLERLGDAKELSADGSTAPCAPEGRRAPCAQDAFLGLARRLVPEDVTAPKKKAPGRSARRPR